MSANMPPAPATMQGNANSTLSPAALLQTTHIGDLTNKVALITGASSGLGRAIAQAYAAAGAYIVNADLSPNPPDAPILAETMRASKADITTPTVDLLNGQFPAGAVSRAMYVQCDVTNSTSMANAVDFAAAHYGRLDVMVNNAGVALEIRDPVYQATGSMRIHECPEDVFDKTIAVNLKGVWLGCKYAAAQMLKQQPHPSGDRGWIINMSSIMGLITMPGISPYCASKGAVLQITKSVALEYAADRIHVNCINPGFIETHMLEAMMQQGGVEAGHAMLNSLHPWGRMGMPEDIAKMAVFLAGPGASFCTGQPFVVDGGYTAQ